MLQLSWQHPLMKKTQRTHLSISQLLTVWLIQKTALPDPLHSANATESMNRVTILIRQQACVSGTMIIRTLQQPQQRLLLLNQPDAHQQLQWQLHWRSLNQSL